MTFPERILVVHGRRRPGLSFPVGIDEIVSRVAKTELTVLIRGETGTGKSVLAERLHDMSCRALKPFHRIDCAALAEGLFGSELFGHTEGAFTGSVARREGLLAQGKGGSILLDEISVLTTREQSRLLTVLEDRKLRSVGSDTTTEIDVRFICATNEDLRALVKQRRFRQDLLSRCRQVEIELPPLRARLEELPVIVRRLVWELMPAFPNLHTARVEVTRAALHALREQRFERGNIRELRNLLARALLWAEGGRIDEVEIIRAVNDGSVRLVDDEPALLRGGRARYVAPEDADKERRRIVEALTKMGNKRAAAALLGMHRRTLYRKLDEHDIRENEWRARAVGAFDGDGSAG